MKIYYTNSDSNLFQKTVSDLTGKKVSVASKGLSINFDKFPF